jgi:hypothetical protein
MEGFQRFDDERRKLGVTPSECLVAIETAYNLLVDFLLDRGYLVYLIPPRATSDHTRQLGKWLSVSRCLVIGPEPLVQYP